MPFWYKAEVMPSSSATVTSWLDAQGANRWQLVNVIPLTPILSTSGSGTATATSGQVLCYFISGSN